MRAARAVATLLIVGSLASVTVASAVSRRVVRLPAGTGRALTARSCLICHSAMLITQQHKDSTGWEKTVSLMQKWGAPIQGAAHDTLVTYLRAHFGNPPANVP